MYPVLQLHMKVPSSHLPAVKMSKVLFPRRPWSIMQAQKITGLSSKDHISRAKFQPVRSGLISQWDFNVPNAFGNKKILTSMSWATKTERIKNNQTAMFLQFVQTIFWTISTWLKIDLPSRFHLSLGGHHPLLIRERKCISFYTRHKDCTDSLSFVLELDIKTPLAASGDNQVLPEKRAPVSDTCSRMN